MTTPLPARLDADPRERLVTPGRAGQRGDFVVYWPQLHRRASDNAALSYAIAQANARRLPLVVYEALRVDYPHASERFHAFVLEGAREEAARYRARGATYVFFLPRSRDEARGVVAALCERAALLVTDDAPAFVVPEHLRGIAKRAPCPVVAFDDNAVVPLALFPKEEYAARTLRPKLHRLLPAWLRPVEEPVVERALRRFEPPFAPFDVENAALSKVLAALPIDHAVAPVRESPGGRTEALRRVARLLKERLARYPEHSHPDVAATSTLSPYLHFGMLGARELALAVQDASAPQEARDAFLEQLLVRRGLAQNLASTNPAHTSLQAAPGWALETLRAHEGDRRAHLYDRATLEAARTHDALWNAGQRELVATGVMHNYVRMLWGKCVLTWKATAEEAFRDLVYLNDKYALDGRDPNTYTGVLWCFGKHDRPWPSRPIFGTVRSMTTASAAKKLKLEGYLARWGAGTGRLF